MAHTGEQSNAQPSIQSYFAQLQTRLVVGLVVCFIIPNAVLSAYFHFQFTHTLKRSGMSNLAAVSESQRNTIDLFLQERVVNLFNLFHSSGFTTSPSQDTMDHFLRNLTQVSDSFIDVGFLNDQGLQIGYSGPFPELLAKDYSAEAWFSQLMNHTRQYSISDTYLGFRQRPHFTIATRQMIDNRFYVMRSTLDPDKFYMFLRAISHGKEVESILINKDGRFQVVDPGKGDLMGVSDVVPPETVASGVMETERAGQPVLVAYAWLKETPWALLVMQPLAVAHAKMYSARRILTASLILINLTIIILILVTTHRLIRKARTMAERGQTLEHQLIHASKLASLGELATGVAHEINNPLAIITSTTGVIRDMFNPEFNLSSEPKYVIEELDIIDEAAFRAKGITHQLLDMGRKSGPHTEDVSINELIDEVLKGLKEREFAVNDIEIVRQYDPGLPLVNADRDRLRQVLLNLVNNAGDAIKEEGAITVATEAADGHVRISVKDTGEGISPENLKRIFNPFFTTKGVGKGTGLGLSISANIVESMGGGITVQSIIGKGSVFTVSLPIHHG